MKKIFALAVVILAFSANMRADTQHEVFDNASGFKASVNQKFPDFDPLRAELRNPPQARALLSHTILAISKDHANFYADQPADFREPGVKEGVYCIIHLLRWADAKPGDTTKQDIQAQNWYLFREEKSGKTWSQEDFTTRNFILGAKKVYLLYVHFNVQHVYAPNYDIVVEKQVPSNIAHLFGLLQGWGAGVSSSKGTGFALAAEGGPDSLWGGGILNIEFVPSTIQITANERKPQSALFTQLGQNKYTDEGDVYWDVSFAGPLKSISNIQINSVSGAVAPANVDQYNIFAVFNLYAPGVSPQRTGLEKWPHLIGGIAYARQPLHKIIVGAAWGLASFEVYAGEMFVKEPLIQGVTGCSVGAASTALSGSQTHFCRQFTYGFNVPISTLVDRLKPK